MLVHCGKILKNGTRITINRRFTTARSFEEIKIPMPWGDLAGKWWGPQNSRPILALHGWQDNAGSFDRLVPYLPPHIGILALDFPGHGLSSNIPNGCFYHNVDAVTCYRRVIKYFNWPRVSFLSHSIGAMHSVMYTMFYPNEVDFLICLDGLFYILESHSRPEKLIQTIDNFLRYEDVAISNSKPPCHTLSKLEEMLHIGSNKSINMDCANHILQRNTKLMDSDSELYYFTRDLRLKVGSLMQWPVENLLEDIKRVKCPLFFSLGNESYLRRYKDSFTMLLDIIKQGNNLVYEHDVEGTHHTHLNTPENVGNLVHDFIMKYYTADNIAINAKI